MGDSHGAHGHDAHGHDEHNGLPPPEPENVAVRQVILWGAASFVFVIAAIMLIGSYFWVERLAEEKVKAGNYGANQEKIKLLRAEETRRLTTYQKLEEGRYQVPIDRAMELVVADYQRHAAAPKAPPVVPVAPATEAPVAPVSAAVGSLAVPAPESAAPATEQK